MKVLCWNIQGGKKPQAVTELLYLKNKYNPDIIFVIETLTNNSNSQRILKALHFHNKLIIDPVNHMGGMWVCWNNSTITVQHYVTHDRLAHLDILYKPHNKMYSILGTYCPAQNVEKDPFWSFLTNYVSGLQFPWLLLGDFNEMLSPQDKMGGSPLKSTQLKRLPLFLSTSRAMDIPCLQQAYSWRGISQNNLIFERLDRAISHQSFYNAFGNSTISYGPFTVSDHAPLLFSSNDGTTYRPPPFRFQNFWTLDKHSHTIVRKHWNVNITGSQFFRIQQKLSRIKTGLKSWAKTYYRHTTNKLLTNEEKLKELQTNLWHQPFNTILIKHINRLILQREKLLLFNQKSWGQSARKQWLTQGDRNSRFFHNRMKKTMANMTIFRLKNDIGQWVGSNADLTHLLSDSFASRFRTAYSTPREINLDFIEPFISSTDIDSLLAPISSEDVKNAFFDINPLKAPGSDGFGGKFYQAYWPIIGPELITAVQSFFHHGKLPPSLNHTLITLIPKKEAPESPDHFRPISLINTIYKAISKILVTRLRPILQREISPLQNAFTRDRSIHDNLLIAKEALNTFRKSKNKTGWCALKLDMEKAYDRIEWDFLWQTLKAFGFPPTWVSWIQECVSNVSYSIKVNGQPSPWFRPSRGLRQGDPLSPYLFILCMEVLIRKLTLQSHSRTSGIGFKLHPRTATVPCLMFADDSLPFCKATSTACTNLKTVLDNFCALSGQLVNFHKSTIIFSRTVPPTRKTALASHFNMLPNSSLGRYLGIFFSTYHPSKADLSHIVQKTQQRISLWESGFLSKAGRLTLIQSNLEALPSYTCASTMLPAKIAKSIDTLHRNFFWRQHKDKNATPLIAWDRICTLKAQGGLGLRQTLPMNKAFLAKLSWKILTEPHNLWVQLVTQKYLRGQSFFMCTPKPTDSPIWRKILQQQSLLQQGIRWKIGDGSQILFWLHNWCSAESLMAKLNLTKTEIDPTLRVQEFILANRTWDIAKLKQLLPDYLISSIKGIPLPIHPLPDTPIWGPSTSGKFTVRTANWLAHNIPQSTAKWPHRWIWNIDIPPKLQNFLWQLFHNSLGVREVLAKRHIIPLSHCGLCTTHNESIDHLFGGCPSLIPLWQLPDFKDWIPHFLPLPTVPLTLSNLRPHQPSLIKFVFLLWSIWKERNSVIFRTEPLNIHRILHKAKFLFSEWTLRTKLDLCDSYGTSFSSSLTPPPPPVYSSSILVSWEPPPPSFFKLNFDGSVRGASAAAGIIIRDNGGNLITAAAFNLGSSSVFSAEASALQQGLRLALQHNIQHLHIESDNLMVINSVKGLWSPPWQIAHLIQDIQQLLQSFSSSTIRHVYREANKATDWVANVGHLVESQFTIDDCTNFALHSILVHDRVGAPLVRRVS